MKKIQLLVLILVISLCNQISTAQIHLPALFKDNMVLQQNFETPIWGWAKPGTEINVSGSWSKMPVQKTIANSEGKWMVKLPTIGAGGPYEIYVNSHTIKNVMLGEVWICSGQSNMQWSLSQTENAMEEVKNAQYPDVRFFYVARDHADEPSRDCYGSWEECTPQSAKSFSAVAYYFGKDIHQELNVPIGLIHVSWGGSSAQAWINENILESTPEGKFYTERYKRACEQAASGILLRNQQSPSALYNAMLKPLIPYGIGGVIWYQGEANTMEHEKYENLFTTLVSNWRDEWGQGDFPFYYVQLAPFNYKADIVGAALRDAQRHCLKVPNTGMAVTLDIGNPDDIHPLKKKEVGERLALWAMAKTYDKEEIVYSGPLYKSMKIKKDKIELSFDHIGSGLYCKGDDLSHFTIAGINRKFFPAKAQIKDDKVMVFSPEVKKPIAVRFAFNNGDEPNFYNKEGLPASTFRTDDWEIITSLAEIRCDFDTITKAFIISMQTGEGGEIRYTTDGSEPNIRSNLYSGVFSSNTGIQLRAKVFVNEQPSLVTTQLNIVKHKATGKKVTYINKYNPSYPSSGNLALVNSIFGSKSFRDGNWQGFQGKDLELIIDLEQIENISSIQLKCLQVVDSWIVLPKNMKIYSSADGVNFKEEIQVEHNISINNTTKLRYSFDAEFDNLNARYVKIKAENYGELPVWHLGAGGQAWIFADEIIVN